MIIGICGKSGSGKSTLTTELLSTIKNSVSLEIDKVGHSVLLLDDVKEELVNCFGNSIIKSNNVDRKELGEIVFNSRNAMECLNDIVWNHMEQSIDDFIKNNVDKIIILDWLLLPLTKYYNLCDYKILLDVPYKIRKERAMKRDNISAEAFALRDRNSIDYKLEDFDYVIKDNEKEKIRKLVSKL